MKQANPSSLSVPCSPCPHRHSTAHPSQTPKPSRRNIQKHSPVSQPQPVIKILKQTASKLTGSMTGTCGGILGNSLSHTDSNTSIAYNLAKPPFNNSMKKESLLNRLFKRSKSKEPASHQRLIKLDETFKHHQAHIDTEPVSGAKRVNACFSMSNSSSTSLTNSGEHYKKSDRVSIATKTVSNELSSSGYESFVNESQNDTSSDCLTSQVNNYNSSSRMGTLQRIRPGKSC